MALKLWWLGAALLVAVLALVGWRWRRGPDRARAGDGLWLANTARIRALPRYRELLGRRIVWLRIELVLIAVAMTGAILLASRPVGVASDSREMRSRDVMLCLDVSGSMFQADAIVVRSYLDLVDQLHGERIGMVVWNSSASLAFPLTDDYVFAKDQLTRMYAQMTGATTDDPEIRAIIKGASEGTGGSSLIGDGLMSCLLRFDQQAEVRPRTVVFATDNQLSGRPFFTLEEAGQKAVEEKVLVMGMMPVYEQQVDSGTGPDASPTSPYGEMTAVLERTGGEVIRVNGADPAVNARIVQRIESQQRKAIMVLTRTRSFDQTVPGTILLAVGALGMIVVVPRGRR